jgi:hypothetical protein
MSNKVFLADVDVFLGKTLDQMTRVARQSIDDVVAIAQTPVAKGGNMPVDTGALRNSLVSQIIGGSSNQGADSYMVTIAGLEIGDVARFEWTAEYAVPRHYAIGVGQGGGLWRDAAVQQWAQIVRKNAGQVK